MAQERRTRGPIKGGQAAIVPETGAIPNRPANFKYVSAQLGTTDANQLQWDAQTTGNVTTFVVEWSAGYLFSGVWVQQTVITNTGVANVYTLADQVADRFFRVKAVNAIGNASYWAGPINNRDPQRTVTIKGRFLTPNKQPVLNGQIWMELSGSDTQIDVDGYIRMETTKINAVYEANTGFWEMKVPQSDAVGDRTGKFYFRGANSLGNTEFKTLPGGDDEDVFYTDLVDA